MDLDRFHMLLSKIEPLITKQDTPMRQAISPGERLAITLRYLASGNSFMDLQYLYRVSNSTISLIVNETVQDIYEVLRNEYLKVPNSEACWVEVTDEFQQQWQFPNCIGALDGKHFAIQAPPGKGFFYNYKGFHSIIPLALVDANYKFIDIDVGRNGRCGDAGVFNDSTLFHGLESGTLGIPGDKTLPHSATDVPLPMVIVGDAAFPLKRYLLNPYPDSTSSERVEKQIFNYRLSRARRCSENAFGLLAKRFQLFANKMLLGPSRATEVVKCCVALHNFLLTENDESYKANVGMKEVECDLTAIPAQGGNRHGNEALRVRDTFRNYFCHVNKLPWQDALS